MKLVKKRQQAYKPDVCMLVHGASMAWSTAELFSTSGMEYVRTDNPQLSQHAGPTDMLDYGQHTTAQQALNLNSNVLRYTVFR